MDGMVVICLAILRILWPFWGWLSDQVTLQIRGYDVYVTSKNLGDEVRWGHGLAVEITWKKYQVVEFLDPKHRTNTQANPQTKRSETKQ